MSVSEDLINFDIIESQKENIQSLPGGRSAKSLATLFTPSPLHKLSTLTPNDTKTLNDAIRQEYEAEVATISESDDPLDIYDRYVRWTLDAYPSAQATPQSQLLPLLERATKTFLNSSQYKNDPRYLKLWLTYIRFFSDSPRETYAYLSRHSVGDGLALFYEEFASWLEGAGRWAQAEEVYKLGIEREARPAPRLLRKFSEFQQRYEQQPPESRRPSSPALPTVRPVLAAKIDPFTSSSSPVDPQAPRPNSGVGGSSIRSGRAKLAVFSDAEGGPPAPASSEGLKGWESIGSLAERKKENVMEPKPWAGETLKAGGKKSNVPKMAVFKDQSLSQSTNIESIIPAKDQIVTNPRNGRVEHIFVNLEAVYPTPEIEGNEMCFEELRASSRGWLGKTWTSERYSRDEEKDDYSFDQTHIGMDSTNPSVDESSSRDVSEKLVIARDPVILDENGGIKEVSRPKNRRLKTMEVNETQIIKTKLSSPSGKKLKRKASAEPTMTFHTRAATDEIYELFNAPLPSQKQEAVEDDDSESDQDQEDGDETDGDYTSGGESTGTGRLVTTSEAGDDTEDVKSVSEWSDFTARKHVPNLDGVEDDTRGTEDDVDNNDTRASRLSEIDQEDNDTRESYRSDGNEEEEEDSVEQLRAPEPIDTKVEAEPQIEVVTPASPEPSFPVHRTSFVPIPPEDYVAPTRPYRDPAQVSQNRLPFMTPIAEKTESSLGADTARGKMDYFSCKTPSKENGAPISEYSEDDQMSSPFNEIINESVLGKKIAQPILERSTKDNKSKPAPNAQVAAVKDAPTKGPILNDTQCNPVDDYTRQMILENLNPPLSTYDGFFDHSSESRGKSAEIKKFAKAVTKMSKNSADKNTTIISIPPVLTFSGTDREYMVKRELGAGAFAPVYLVKNIAEEDDEIEAGSAVMGRGTFDSLNRQTLEALKMEDPPTPWEFYMMRTAQRRLGVSRAVESILPVYEMHLYADECYLFEAYRDQGTLLDLVNLARADSGGVMDEPLVMFFAIELFRTVEALHTKGLLHGDLKADNCLVRLSPIPAGQEWSSRYRRDGSGGWASKGITLIDFGRGIDMRCFRPDVQFIADWKTGPQDCAEMRELRPWTWQIDYMGLAGVVHSLLFGKYIDTVVEKGHGPASASSTTVLSDADPTLGFGASGAAVGPAQKKYRLKEPLKRYWQTEIWSAVFDLLLNPREHVEGEEGGKMPLLRGMKGVREKMEEWLEGNCERGVGLLAGVRRLEGLVGGKRR